MTSPPGFLRSPPPEGAGLLYFLQVATSSFPTGAFSHSYGFEQLIAEEQITNADSLQRELHRWLRYGVATADGAACALAWDAANGEADPIPVLAAIDETLYAIRITRETRQASLSTGSAFIIAAFDAFHGTQLGRYREAVAAGTCMGQFATAFGVAATDAGASRHSAVLAFLHGSFSSLVSVAARLIPLGQIATQRIITDAVGVIEDCCETSLATGIDELATTTPALDLASMAHERLYTRLCIS